MAQNERLFLFLDLPTWRRAKRRRVHHRTNEFRYFLFGILNGQWPFPIHGTSDLFFDSKFGLFIYLNSKNPVFLLLLTHFRERQTHNHVVVDYVRMHTLLFRHRRSPQLLFRGPNIAQAVKNIVVGQAPVI